MITSTSFKPHEPSASKFAFKPSGTHTASTVWGVILSKTVRIVMTLARAIISLNLFPIGTSLSASVPVLSSSER